jgi:hypothetical protein
MYINGVLCHSVPHLGTVHTHVTIGITWLITLGGGLN